MSNAKQVKAVEPLINGLPATDTFKSGDGVALFSTAHPTVAGTFANTLATQADLNETSLEQSLIDIAAMTDERGLRIAARGVKMIIPSELQFTAERLMKSQGRVGTADNDVNAIVSMGMIPQGYRVNNYLTDSDAFYIITDVPNGMKMFQRAALTTGMEGDFDTGNVRYKARERYSFGVSDPRGIFGVERFVINLFYGAALKRPHLQNKLVRFMRKYLIQIFTKYLQTKFEIESNKDINTVEELHPHIIDFLGKSDIKWEQNDLQYTSTVNDFYITYEEVNNGSTKDGVVREENTVRV
jgi:hypothetical protein